MNDGIPDEILAIGSARDYKAEAAERLPIPGLDVATTVVDAKEPTPRQAAARSAIDELAEKITPEQVALAHSAMRQLAGMDQDHAAEQNGIGFSGTDTGFGHKLAEADHLSPKQAAYAVKLAIKYRKQVGDLFPEFYAKKTEKDAEETLL